MTDSETAGRLRKRLADCRQAKGFNKYPSDVREEAVAYAQGRRSQGAGPSLIAKELGVAVTTADAWCELGADKGYGRWPDDSVGGSDKLSLVPVAVAPQAPQRVVSRLEVDFGDGTKLQATGISAEDLARAIHVLRRSM